jgi:pilus assembly protein CpaB
MARRIITIVLAALLAVVGGSLTYLYASGADRRAMADLEPTSVLVVAEPVAAGTPAEELSELVEMREVPAGSEVPGGVDDLSQVKGLVTSADLVPGEQLVKARFVASEDLDAGVTVPEGHHRVSIELEPRRVIGGQLRPGDTVGVFVSLNSDGSEKKTHLILHKVIVTDVRGGVREVEDEDKDGEETETAPAEMVMVTLAVPATDAEKVVYAAEYELVWLSIEPEEASENGTRIITPEVIFE